MLYNTFKKLSAVKKKKKKKLAQNMQLLCLK